MKNLISTILMITALNTSFSQLFSQHGEFDFSIGFINPKLNDKTLYNVSEYNPIVFNDGLGTFQLQYTRSFYIKPQCNVSSGFGLMVHGTSFQFGTKSSYYDPYGKLKYSPIYLVFPLKYSYWFMKKEDRYANYIGTANDRASENGIFGVELGMEFLFNVGKPTYKVINDKDNPNATVLNEEISKNMRSNFKKFNYALTAGIKVKIDDRMGCGFTWKYYVASIYKNEPVQYTNANGVPTTFVLRDNQSEPILNLRWGHAYFLSFTLAL